MEKPRIAIGAIQNSLGKFIFSVILMDYKLRTFNQSLIVVTAFGNKSLRFI